MRICVPRCWSRLIRGVVLHALGLVVFAAPNRAAELPKDPYDAVRLENDVLGVREGHTEGDDQDAVVELHARHVPPDLTDASQEDDARGPAGFR